jgi:hypothetical protein
LCFGSLAKRTSAGVLFALFEFVDQELHCVELARCPVLVLHLLLRRHCPEHLHPLDKLKILELACDRFEGSLEVLEVNKLVSIERLPYHAPRPSTRCA